MRQRFATGAIKRANAEPEGDPRSALPSSTASTPSPQPTSSTRSPHVGPIISSMKSSFSASVIWPSVLARQLP